MQMNLGQSIRSGVRWLLIGSVSTQFLQFGFGIVPARLLVPADFGMIVTIQIFTGFVAMFATGGMGQSLIRAKEAADEDFDAVFTLQLVLGVLICTAFFVSAPWIARYLNDPLYSDLLRVSALSFIMRPFAVARISWLTREMEFKKRALVDVSMGVLTGVASVLMAAAGMGVWSLTLSGLGGAFVLNIVLGYVTPLRLRLRFDGDSARKHGAYGFKITAIDFLTYFIEQSINVILGKLAGPGMVGLYNKSESLSRMPNRLVTPPTGQTVFRAMGKVQDDLDKTKYIFYRTITLLTVYVFPFLLGLWWVADPFIVLVYGEKWSPSVEPLRIMILIGFLRTIATPSAVLLAAQNRLVQQLIAQSIGLLVAVTACLIGLNWGLKGVAWGSVVTAAFLTTCAYALVYRAIPTRLADLFRAATPALLLNAVLLVILALAEYIFAGARSANPWFYLLMMVFAGSVSYTCAFLFLPISALRSETLRWRRVISAGLRFLFRFGA